MAEELEVAVQGVKEAMTALQGLAVIMNSAKSVSLMIKNRSNKALVYKNAYQTSGIIFEVPQNRIEPDTSATLGFHRTTIGLCGTEGVVVYEVDGRNLYLCIFYCVPMIGRNGFFIKIKDAATNATADLCAEMAAEQWEIEDQITWHNDELRPYHAIGFMTQGDDAKMIVQVQNA